MKKSKFVVALAAMLLLGACGGGSESSPLTPSSEPTPEPASSETTPEPASSELPSSIPESSDPVSSDPASSEPRSSEPTSSESSDPASSETPSSGSSSIDVPPTGWSEQDLEAMDLLFAPLNDFVLPFPEGLTSSYTNISADYIDQGNYYFSVVDYECGDLTDSYGAQLEKAGLVYAGYSDYYYDYYGLTYTIYQYCVPDSLEAITVELDYYDGSQEYYGEYFEILACYGEEDGSYFDDAFPYNRIETELGVTNASSAIPSFSTLESDGYMSYWYVDTDTYTSYFAVSGTYASTANEATLYSEYKAALAELGYTVEDDAEYENYGYASNATLGYDIFIDVYEGDFTIYIIYTEPSGGETTKGNDVSAGGTTALVGESSITMTQSNFPSTYSANEEQVAINGITFGYFRVCRHNEEALQFSSQNKTSGYLWNVTSLGTIKSIEIKATVDQYYGVLSLYLSSSAITSIDGLDYVTPTQTSTGYVYNINGTYSHFYLINEDTQYASKNGSITINYTL